jgi:TonB family protein
MNSVSEVSTPSVATDRPKRSAFSRATERCSGTVVSFLLHGTLVALAFFSVSGPRMGRGGGIVGRVDGGSGPPAYSAQLRQDAALESERTPDTRLYPTAEPEVEEAPEAVPATPEDFLREQSDTGIPVAKNPPPSEDTRPTRPPDAYSKLPPSASSETEEAAAPGNGQKGNSTVGGSGGDTGGAGDGNAGALYMPAPEYPTSARRKGIEGIVVVAVEVHADGRCEHPQLLQSSGCDALDEAALAAIRKWRYEARPDEGTMIRRVRFVFKLQR